ncbi:hypothetical protein TWF730_010336 [Orbilia blumenaviensis]|uniref:F-box domain-containing protein n=1 Tax=Orbilia blumenaviensis TaxID=1796055 RepID=A0AAV9UMZ2_9PEZI
MFIPPEILLTILEELKTDRRTLHSLRLVDRYFYQLATDALFGNFSIHYGFKHSVAQMKSIIKSPSLKPYIRSLHLPSESFYPIAKNFTVKSGTAYRFPWSRDPPEDFEPPARRSCYEQQTDSSDRSYQGFLEVPTNRRARFDFAVKRYKKEYDVYTKALTDFLDGCVNLRAVHITTGLGYDRERSEAWSSMITSHVFPILVKHGVRELKISVASGRCLLHMLKGYGNVESIESGRVPKFPSITSLAITAQYNSNYRLMGSALNGGFAQRLNGFLSTMPNLTTYSAGNTGLVHIGMELLPESAAYKNITSINIFYMILKDEVYDNFKSMIFSMPSLTDLTLDTIALHIDSPLRREFYVERMNTPETLLETLLPRPCMLDIERQVTVYMLSDPPAETTWKYFFDIFQRELPQLTNFSFKRLLYSGFDIRDPWSTSLAFYIPIQDRMDYNREDFMRFAKSTHRMELVSTLESDYLALHRFRRAINAKRQKRGLPELEAGAKSIGFGTKSHTDDSREEILQFEHRTENEMIAKLRARDLGLDGGTALIDGFGLLTSDEGLFHWGF